MRILVTLLLSLHALLHLLGFLKSWGLAALPELSGKTLVPLSPALTRVIGLLWLLGAFVLLTAAALRALRSDTWWLVASVGVVVSQALIVLQWSDAKAGTAANVLIAAAIVVHLADRWR